MLEQLAGKAIQFRSVRMTNKETKSDSKEPASATARNKSGWRAPAEKDLVSSNFWTGPKWLLVGSIALSAVSYSLNSLGKKFE
jgi:hypothetical protein